MSSLVNNLEMARGHAHLPCPPFLSHDSVSSLLISIICTLSDLGACPLDAKLTELGLNSFDAVRIANQIMAELGGGGGTRDSHMIKVGLSHDGHMTMLMEKLLNCQLKEVVEYIVECLVVSCDSHMIPTGEQEGRGICRVRASSQESESKRSKVSVGSNIERSRVGTGSGVERSKVGTGSKFDERSNDVRELKPNDNVCRAHVIYSRGSSATVRMESWRRGQCFVNGR